ncbi:unnamed protein product [Cochlearia groenlandica]
MSNLDFELHHDNKENVTPSNIAIIYVIKPDKDKTQTRTRKPLHDITNLFVSSSSSSSSSPLSSSVSNHHVYSSPKCISLKTPTSSCRNFR